jgi:hypothetical protein
MAPQAAPSEFENCRHVGLALFVPSFYSAFGTVFMAVADFLAVYRLDLNETRMSD